MKNNKLQEKLENYIIQKGINIVRGSGNFKGGFCIINKKKFFVINKNEPTEQNIIQMINLIENKIGASSKIESLLVRAKVNDK